MATYVRDITPTTHHLTVANVDLAAADASKTIIPAPQTGMRIRVFHAVYISKTSAAQALSLDCGATNLLDLAASVTAHSVIDTGWMDNGIECPAATALIATPAAAGPAGKFLVTYWTE